MGPVDVGCLEGCTGDVRSCKVAEGITAHAGAPTGAVEVYGNDRVLVLAFNGACLSSAEQRL